MSETSQPKGMLADTSRETKDRVDSQDVRNASGRENLSLWKHRPGENNTSAGTVKETSRHQREETGRHLEAKTRGTREQAGEKTY